MMSQVGPEKEPFGYTADGVPVDRYTLRNSYGIMARLINYGASVTELWTPDRQGRLADVVLGFDRLSEYESQNAYLGCMIGRVAFRIAKGQFVLGHKAHQLTLNDGPHHTHGGMRGFNRVVWQAEPMTSYMGPAVKFVYSSPDGDQGYPGTLDVAVVYTLTEENELWINCTATTDRPTPVNLTHHGYFNLAGAGEGDVLGHVLQIDADRWLPSNGPNLPTGEIASVTGTPFDFTRPKRIGAHMGQTGNRLAGYDLCYLRNHRDETLACVATLQEPVSGRRMEVKTTEPGVVLYTGNHLDGSLRGKNGAVYQRYAGVCLETGRPPDAIHYPYFPSVILRPGKTYRHTCVYRFSTI